MDTTDRRPFGIWTATALVVGGMIGSGIFLMPSALAPFGWTASAAWGVSIAGALAIAFTLARLTATMPAASGAVAVVGAVLGVGPALLIGWSYWVAVWAANAAIAVAATAYLAALVPGLDATPLTGALVSVALIWGLTLLNVAGAKRAGEFQVVTTVLKLLPLLAVVGIALWLGAAGVAAPLPLPPLRVLGNGLAGAVALTLFPLVGFEAAGVAAERVREPVRTVMRATMAGTAVTGLLYIAVCSAIVLLLPQAEVAASPAPFALFVETFAGHAASLPVAAFAAIAAVGALNGWILIQGEVPLGMARAGLLPTWFAGVSRRDVPVRVLVLSSALASALVLSRASGTLGGVFTFAALLSTCATLWLYLGVCVAALARRVAVVPAAIGLPFTLFAFWGAGAEASGLSLVLMLTAVPVYAVRRKVQAGTTVPG
jgi:APA family basic amino acid/polyamine antiporter